MGTFAILTLAGWTRWHCMSSGWDFVQDMVQLNSLLGYENH